MSRYFAVTVLKHSLPPVLIVQVTSFSTNSTTHPLETVLKGSGYQATRVAYVCNVCVFCVIVN